MRFTTGGWYPSQHAPIDTDGKLYNPVDYLIDIVAGFEVGANAAIKRRSYIDDVLCAPQPPVRIALRPTSVYVAVVEEVAREQLSCRHSGDLSAALSSKLGTTHWHLAAAVRERVQKCEIASLLAGDIPVFFADVDRSTILNEDHIELGEAFPEPPLTFRRNLLHAFSSADIESQKKIIRASLLSKL